MYEKRVDGTIVGKLNDFDLAHVDGHPRPADWGRTGTMPFMALDLLTKKAWEGKVARLYRHDCESFAWVLLWICARYENGKEIPDPPFEKWRAHCFTECLQVKYLEDFTGVKGTSSYEPFWLCAVALLMTHIIRIRRVREAANHNVYEPTPLPGEPTTLQVIQEWSDVFDKPVFHAIDNPLKDLKLAIQFSRCSACCSAELRAFLIHIFQPSGSNDPSTGGRKHTHAPLTKSVVATPCGCRILDGHPF